MPYLKRIKSLPLINHISYKYAQVSDIGPSWSSCSLFLYSTKVDAAQNIEEEINLIQESAPLNENVEFMEDQLTTQARENAEREKLTRRSERSAKRKSFKSFGRRNSRGKKVVIKQEVEEEDSEESEDSEVEVKVQKKRGKPIVENDVCIFICAVLYGKLAICICTKC